MRGSARAPSYERILIGALGIAGAVLFALTFGFDTSGDRSGDLGTAFVPRVFSALLVALCAFVLLRGGRRREATGGDHAPRRRPDATLGGAVVLLVAYVVALPSVGYAVSTGLMLVGLLAMLRAGAWWSIAAFAAGVTAFTYFIFERVLVVGLPAGPWGF